MPRFFAPGPSSASLAHWIGWRLGAGVASIGREVDYLTQRAKTASERERSAWLSRCIVSCALVTAEYFFLYVILSRRDTLLALGSAWLVLLLLPRPTPRIPPLRRTLSGLRGHNRERFGRPGLVREGSAGD